MVKTNIGLILYDEMSDDKSFDLKKVNRGGGKRIGIKQEARPYARMSFLFGGKVIGLKPSKPQNELFNSWASQID